MGVSATVKTKPVAAGRYRRLKSEEIGNQPIKASTVGGKPPAVQNKINMGHMYDTSPAGYKKG